VKRYCCWISTCLLLVVACPALHAAELPTVAVVATGGTIAMKVDSQTGGPVPALSGEDLVAAVPELKDLASIKVIEFPESLPRVDLVPMYPGADGSHVRHAVDAGAQGIVVEAYGWGNVNEPMYDAIKYARDKAIPVVVTTRVPNGRALPVYASKGGGATLKQLGAVFGDDLGPWKARVLLMLALSQTKEPEKLQAYFDK
jgi:L-asparaginase/Glu-tRNA(Gln) amidotransferase subunit D